MLERLLHRLPDIALATSEPLTRSITGIEAMPVVFSPSGPMRAGGQDQVGASESST
jgi:hypothetical protein